MKPHAQTEMYNRVTQIAQLKREHDDEHWECLKEESTVNPACLLAWCAHCSDTVSLFYSS